MIFCSRISKFCCCCCKIHFLRLENFSDFKLQLYYSWTCEKSIILKRSIIFVLFLAIFGASETFAEAHLFPEDLQYQLCPEGSQQLVDSKLKSLSENQQYLFWLSVWANSVIKTPHSGNTIYWQRLVKTFCQEINLFEVQSLNSPRLNKEFLEMTIQNISNNFEFVDEESFN